MSRFDFDLFLPDTFMAAFPHDNTFDALMSDMLIYVTHTSLIVKIQIGAQNILPSDALILNGTYDAHVHKVSDSVVFEDIDHRFILRIKDFLMNHNTITYSDALYFRQTNMSASDNILDITTVSLPFIDLALVVAPVTSACAHHEVLFQTRITNQGISDVQDVALFMAIKQPGGSVLSSDIFIGIIPGHSDVIQSVAFMPPVGGRYDCDFLATSHSGLDRDTTANRQSFQIDVRSIQIKNIQLNHHARSLTDPTINLFAPSDLLLISCMVELEGPIKQTQAVLLFNNHKYDSITSDEHAWQITMPDSDGIYLATIIVQDASDLNCSDTYTVQLPVANFTVTARSDIVINYGESITIDIDEKDKQAIYTVSGGHLTNFPLPAAVTPTVSQMYQITGQKGNLIAIDHLVVKVRRLSLTILSIETDQIVDSLYVNSHFNVHFGMRLVDVGPSDSVSDVAHVLLSFNGSDYISDFPVFRGSDVFADFRIPAPSIASDYRMEVRASLVSHSGCSDRVTKVLPILESSDPPVITALSVDKNRTAAGQAVLISVSANASDLTYQLSAHGEILFSTNVNVISVRPQATTKYTITALDILGQTASSDITVFVDFIVRAGSDQMILAGQPATLGIGKYLSDVVYNWLPSDGISDVHGFPITVYPATTTTYTLTATSPAHSDLVTQDSVKISVCSLTILQARIRERVIYANSFFEMSADIVAQGFNTMNIDITFNGSDYRFDNVSTSTVPVFSFRAPASDGAYPFSMKAVVANFEVCSDSMTGQIVVTPIPTLSAGSDRLIIFGQSASIGEDQASSDYTYRWMPTTGFAASADTMVFPAVVTPTETTTYTITATPKDHNQVSATLQSSVKVSVCKTRVKSILAPISVLPGELFSVKWSVQAANNQEKHHAYLVFADIYSDRQFGVSNKLPGLDYGGISSFSAPQIPGNYPLSLTVCDSDLQSCSDTATVNISVCSPVLLSGMMTGNGSCLTAFLQQL